MFYFQVSRCCILGTLIISCLHSTIRLLHSGWQTPSTMWECRHSSAQWQKPSSIWQTSFRRCKSQIQFPGKRCHILERVRSLLNRCHTLRHYSQDYILRCLLAQIGILGISHKSIIEFKFFGNAHCITGVISKLVFVLLSCYRKHYNI